MEKSNSTESSRRDFLTKVLPVCAISCFGASRVLAGTSDISESFFQQDKHPFDQEWKNPSNRPVTYRSDMMKQYYNYIMLARTLEKEIGKEKTIELIKKKTEESLLKLGKDQAERNKDNSFESYVKQFREGYEGSLIMEIVEDTKTTFELKVTDCIWAATFLRANEGDIGYAEICWGDYAWARGFNPKISMVRDKTLMQGHEYCNHKYIWTE